MNCHIVPQCYLKSWKIPNSEKNIYIISKDNFKMQEERNISNLKDTYFAMKDEYILKMEKCIQIYQYKEEFKKLYDSKYLQGIQIELDGKVIETAEEFCKEIPRLEDFVYKKKLTQQLLRKKRVRNELQTLWNREISKKIEDFFSEEVERDWEEIKQYLNQELINKKTWKVYPKYRKELEEFIAVQYNRVYDNVMKIPSVISLFNVVNEIFPEFTEEERTELKRTSWMLQLLKYSKYTIEKKEENHHNAITRLIEEFDQYQMFFFITKNTIPFITSDNPCTVISLGTNYPREYTGIYIPLTPKICLYMTKTFKQTEETKSIKF